MNLTWSIKSSFEAYVRGAGGVVELGGDAALSDAGYVFPAISHEGGIWRFGGSVRFEAHGGALSVVIADPTVELEDDAGIVTVATGLEPGATRIELARLVNVDTTDGLAADARVTLLGARLLGDVYPVGSSIDPLRVQG